VKENGQTLHSSNSTLAGLDLSDRDYVRAHRGGTAGGVFVGHPLLGRLSGAWFIGVSRRLEAADGGVRGVVAALAEPKTFRDVYASLDLPPGASVTLLHRDGPILARHPDHESGVGRPARELPLPEPGGAMTLEDDERIVTARASPAFPLAVAVSFNRAAVLAPWHVNLLRGVVIAVAGSLLLGTLTWLLLREIDRRERMFSDLQASAHALRNSKAQLIQDIANRHRVEAELIAARRASDEANQAKTRFLANMSHELRTPLNAIIGFAEALETAVFGPLAAKQAEYIGDIRRAGLHLLSLINDILDSAKVESGKYVLHETILSVPETATECLRQIGPQAAEKGIILALRLAKDLPGLYADERAFKQILLNLLSNAIKFTPPGGRAELLGNLTEDGRLVLRVADTGIGIPPDDLERVLEPFYQVENPHVRHYAGTGLGLPLVRSLVELHGGTLTLESTLGRGTTVTLHYPAERLYVAQAHAHPPTARGEQPAQ
jgi:signal transduction histidine kinase